MRYLRHLTTISPQIRPFLAYKKECLFVLNVSSVLALTLTKNPTGFRGLCRGAPEEPDGRGGLSDDVRRHHVPLDRVEHPREGDPDKYIAFKKPLSHICIGQSETCD